MRDCCRVAIADDAPDFRELLRIMLLTGTGGEFVIAGEATTAAEAVALTGREHPDVLLLDLAMPGAGGQPGAPALDLIAQVHRCAPETRVLVLSGFDSRDLQDQARAAGADAFLTKGVSRPQLLEAIRGQGWTKSTLTKGKPSV